MRPLKTRHTPASFAKYLRALEFERVIDKVILHHTWRPTVQQWVKRGGAYWMDRLEQIYLDNGWHAGPHIFCAPDGIWCFTPLSVRGTHAGKGNEGSIGVEMVGDYTFSKPSGEVLAVTSFVLKELLEKYDLSRERIRFHRDYAIKASGCPGWSISRKWIAEHVRWPNQGRVSPPKRRKETT